MPVTPSSENTIEPSKSRLLRKGKVVLSWMNLTVQRPSSKHICGGCGCKGKEDSGRRKILDDVSGFAEPGHILAIMGSTGSGKTTLLNTLMLRSLHGLHFDGGKVLVNGEATDARSLSRISSYVMQNDLFEGCLTVREHLRVQGRLRIGRKMLSRVEILAEVEYIMQELQLDACADIRIGDPRRGLKGISGGERKRLSLATEVLSNPSVIFCDEPLSGLDSSTALDIVTVLKELAEQGRTIVLTVHQPSSEIFALFDRLLFMYNGRLAFQGGLEEAKKFFSRIDLPCPVYFNPADHYINMLTTQFGEEESKRLSRPKFICDQFSRSTEGTAMIQHLEQLLTSAAVKDPDSPTSLSAAVRRCCQHHPASWCEQFSVLIYRNVLTGLREPLICRSRLFQTIFIAVLMGVIYFDQHLTQDGIMNIDGALYVYLINVSFPNVFMVINVFCANKVLFLREQTKGIYRVDTYFIAKVVADLPLLFLNTIIFSTIFYWAVGLNRESSHNFIIFLTVAILVTMTAIGFGYMLSCLAPNLPIAMALSPALLTPILIYGGFFVNQGGIPSWLAWVKFTSWFYYGMELLMVNQWQMVKEIACASNATRCFLNGQEVLRFYVYSADHNLRDALLLIAFSFAFTFVGFLALTFTTFRATRGNH